MDTTNNQVIFRNIGVITTQFVKFYYYANTIGSEQGGTQVQVRLYANTQAYAVTGGWAIYSGTTGGYNMKDMYYFHNTGYDSTSAPSPTVYTARLYGSSWADSSGYAKFLSINSNSVSVRLYKGTNADFSNVYEMWFRFFT